jgi:hypothetical protein
LSQTVHRTRRSHLAGTAACSSSGAEQRAPVAVMRDVRKPTALRAAWPRRRRPGDRRSRYLLRDALGEPLRARVSVEAARKEVRKGGVLRTPPSAGDHRLMGWEPCCRRIAVRPQDWSGRSVLSALEAAGQIVQHSIKIIRALKSCVRQNPATAMIIGPNRSRPVSMKVSVERGTADTITETGQPEPERRPRTFMLSSVYQSVPSDRQACDHRARSWFRNGRKWPTWVDRQRRAGGDADLVISGFTMTC